MILPVGEIMVEQGTTETFEGIKFTMDDPSGYVSRGTYRFIGIQGDKRLYEPVPETGARIDVTGLFGDLFLVDDGESLQIASYSEKGALLKTMTTADPSAYSSGTYSIYRPNGFQQTLVYLGKDGNKITFSYREFEDDFARPAYTMDVTYSLDESNIIVFKIAKIEVIDASSSSITFRVLDNFNVKGKDGVGKPFTYVEPTETDQERE